MNNVDVILNYMQPTTSSKDYFLNVKLESPLEFGKTYTVLFSAECSQKFLDAGRSIILYLFGRGSDQAWKWSAPTSRCTSVESQVIKSIITVPNSISEPIVSWEVDAYTSHTDPNPDDEIATINWIKVIKGDYSNEPMLDLSNVEYYYTAPGDNAKYTTLPRNTTFVNWDYWYSDNTNRTSMNSTTFGYPIFVISHPVGVYGGIYARGSQFQNKNITVSWDCYCNIPIQWARPAEVGAVVTKEDLIYGETDVGTWKRMYYSGYNQENIIFFPQGHASVAVNIFIKNIKIVVGKLYLDTPGYTINPTDYNYSALVNEPLIYQLTQIRPPDDCTDFLTAQKHIRHLRALNEKDILPGGFGGIFTNSMPSGWTGNGGTCYVSTAKDHPSTSYMGWNTIYFDWGPGIYHGWTKVSPNTVYTIMSLVYCSSNMNTANNFSYPILVHASSNASTVDTEIVDIEWDQSLKEKHWKWIFRTFTTSSTTNYIRYFLYNSEAPNTNQIFGLCEAFMIVPGPVTAFKDLAAWIGYRYPISTLEQTIADANWVYEENIRTKGQSTQRKYIYSDGTMDPWITISGDPVTETAQYTDYGSWVYKDPVRTRTVTYRWSDGATNPGPTQSEIAIQDTNYTAWSYNSSNSQRTRTATPTYTYSDAIRYGTATTQTENGTLSLGDWSYSGITRTRTRKYVYSDTTLNAVPATETETAVLQSISASSVSNNMPTSGTGANSGVWVKASGGVCTVTVTGHYTFSDGTAATRNDSANCSYSYTSNGFGTWNSTNRTMAMPSAYTTVTSDSYTNNVQISYGSVAPKYINFGRQANKPTSIKSTSLALNTTSVGAAGGNIQYWDIYYAVNYTSGSFDATTSKVLSGNSCTKQVSGIPSYQWSGTILQINSKYQTVSNISYGTVTLSGTTSEGFPVSVSQAITQAANNATYSTPTISLSYSGTFPASGGSKVPNLSYSQTKSFTSGAPNVTITSGATTSWSCSGTGFSINAQGGTLTAQSNSSSSARSCTVYLDLRLNNVLATASTTVQQQAGKPTISIGARTLSNVEFEVYASQAVKDTISIEVECTDGYGTSATITILTSGSTSIREPWDNIQSIRVVKIEGQTRYETNNAVYTI